MSRVSLTLAITIALMFTSVGVAVPSVHEAEVTAQTWQGFTRIAGEGRYDTAVQTSQQYFPAGAQTVLLATGENWADALCASALAGAYDAPLLLTRSRSLPAVVGQEITRLAPQRIVLLGGTGAIDNQVRDAVVALRPSATVERLGGGTRYETARLVADRFQEVVGDEWSGQVFVATGANFPDALGASAIAAHTRTPIVLTARNSLPAVSEAAISDLNPDKVLILGGTGAVGSIPQQRIETLAPTTQRLSGSDRYDTCAQVVAYARATWSMSTATIGLSSGANFPDALGAGAALGRVGQVQLLSGRNSLPSRTSDYLENLVGQTTRVTAFGGAGALHQYVLDDVRMVLDPGWRPPAGPFASVSASVSNTQPLPYSTVSVNVRCVDARGLPVQGVNVTTKWNYRTTSPVDSAVSDSDGVATVSRSIGNASVGYTVVVEVTASKDGVTRTTTTSFTPR